MTSGEGQTLEISSKKKPRSPAYPAIDLAIALQRAEKIREEEGRNATNVDTALGHWGYRAKSGQGMAVLSALIKYGLLQAEGSADERTVRLTPLAMKVLLDDRPESAERLAAIREAALLPTIFNEVWKKYQGALPSDSTLRYHLRFERNFQDEAADSCIKNLRGTLSYAQLPASEHMSEVEEDAEEAEGHPETGIVPQLHSDVPTVPEAAVEGITMRTLQIPLTNAPWATIQVPYPMDIEDWEELRAWLNANASPLTKGKVRPERT